MRSTRSDDRGAALIEFALVLPVLLLLVFGALDLGRAFNYWIDETQLAHEGARWAAVDGTPDPNQPNFLAAIREQADTSELLNGNTSSVPNALQVCVHFPTGSAQVGQPVEVVVTSTYRFMSFLTQELHLPFAQTQVVGRSTMRLERPPSFTDGQCA
jgi:Flp pilus assembly protein TadG